MLWLPKTKTVFLHVPCTAGSWVEHALEQKGIEVGRIGDQHTKVPTPDAEFIFTFVRRPDMWLRSRWAKGRFEDSLSLIWVETFEGFVENVLAQPRNLLTEYFQEYTHHAHFIGHQESAVEDLRKALRLSGLTLHRVSFTDVPRYNKGKALPRLTKQQSAAIIAHEPRMMARWYS
jgi:hypothetical protein